MRDGLKEWKASFDKFYSKPCVMRPDIDLPGYKVAQGGHSFIHPTNKVDPSYNSELLLFHGRWLGSESDLVARSIEIRDNRSLDENPVRRQPRKDNRYPVTIAQAKAKLEEFARVSMPVAVVLAAHEQLRQKKSFDDVVDFLNAQGYEVPGSPDTHWTIKALQRFLGIPVRWS